MMSIFRKLMPREDRFFDMFSKHSETVIKAAEALDQLLSGIDVEKNCDLIVALEHQADEITREVLLAVRRSFITPFDRGDIKDLIQSMDDAIDMMHKTVKTIRLFEQSERSVRSVFRRATVLRASERSRPARPTATAGAATGHRPPRRPKLTPASPAHR